MGIACLALSKDQCHLYSAGYDNHIWEWDTLTWTGRRAVRGIGMVSYDLDIKANPEAFISFPGHDSPVLALCSVGDDRLASADLHGAVMVWDTKQWKRLAKLDDHKGMLFAVAEHPGAGLLFSAGEDWNIGVWDMTDWSLVRRWEGHTGPIRCLLTVGDILLSGSADCTIRAWSVLTGVCAREIKGCTGWVMGMCVRDDCERLAASCSDGSVYVMGTATWDILWCVGCVPNKLSCVASPGFACFCLQTKMLCAS